MIKRSLRWRLLTALLLVFALGFGNLAIYLYGTRDELRQLFDLLASPGGRLLMLGQMADWPAASESALQSGLDAWRGARLDLLKSAYEGLRDLVFAVWYGDPVNQDCLPGFGWPELQS